MVNEVETLSSGMPSKMVSMSASESMADADLADLAERLGRVGVEAELRRQIERDRQAGLALLEEILEALVRLLGRAEAGVLPHRPHLAEIHGRDRCRA